MVTGMPKLLSALTVIGTAAMLWVGGHILLVGADELGWHGPYDFVHDLEKRVDDVGGIGGVLAWLINTGISARGRPRRRSDRRRHRLPLPRHGTRRHPPTETASQPSSAAASRSRVFSMPARLCVRRSSTPEIAAPPAFTSSGRRSWLYSVTRHPASVASIV